jgi:hypothetical protein
MLVLDSNEDPLMLVKVKAWGPIDELTIRDVVETLQRSRLTIPFVMLVDPKKIQILQWNGERLSEPLCRLGTVRVLTHYAPDLEAR